MCYLQLISSELGYPDIMGNMIFTVRFIGGNYCVPHHFQSNDVRVTQQCQSGLAADNNGIHNFIHNAKHTTL